MLRWDCEAYPHAVDLTVDAFHALARSSPWRWRSLHFLAAADNWDVEAWVVRPGWLLVRAPGRPDVIETGVPYTTSWVTNRSDAGWMPPDPKAPQDVVPTYRPDGLVSERPGSFEIQYDDPLYAGASFTWVAMLDPEELSHHVSVTDLEVSERHGRETWWATVRALEGYGARCPDCCDLLLGGAARGVDHVVALDVQTGVLVSLTAPEVRDREWFIDNEILAVDEDVVVPR